MDPDIGSRRPRRRRHADMGGMVNADGIYHTGLVRLKLSVTFSTIRN